jgi:heat-inducible transcriptional repressor
MIKDALEERSKKVLCAVVESYIKNLEPVGSRFVTRRYPLGCSSATIRNIMADLEDIGFLSQPHTSAGRIPTDKGYRFYVDYILDIKEVDHDEESREFLKKLQEQLDYMRRDVNKVFSEATNALSVLSNYIGVITPPRPECTTFNRLELIRYRSDQVVAILLTNEGIIKNKVISIPPSYSQDDVNNIVDYLNKEYFGYPLDRIMHILTEKISSEKVQYNNLINKTIKIYQEALSIVAEDIFVSNLYDAINLPDFCDISKIKELSRTIKDKHLILKLLNEFSDVEGVQVIIGDENPISELKGLSIVASAYKEGQRNMGVIALLGPKRMNYSKSIYIVENIAKLISRTFD